MTSTQDVTGKQLPLVRAPACVRAWRRLAPHHRAMPARTYYGSPKNLENTGMLVGVANCGRSWKWGCRGKLALGFKPRHGSHVKKPPCGFGKKRGDHMALARKGESCSFGKKGRTTWLWSKGETTRVWGSLCHAA